MAMNAARGVICAKSTRRLFFAGGDGGGLRRNGGGGGGGGGVGLSHLHLHHHHRRGPQHHGRGAWQWKQVRARLDVAVRPDTYREELDVKIDRARAHFSAPQTTTTTTTTTTSPKEDDDQGDKPNNNQQLAAAAFGAIPLPHTEIHESARSHFRMRAEFRVWHEGDRSFLAMFDSDDPKQPVEIPSFPMGSHRINELMPALLEEITSCEVLRKKLFQVNFLTTVKGDALVSMLYHRRLTEEWEAAAEEVRARLGVSIIGRSRKQKVVLGNDYVMEELEVDGRALSYKQLEGGFTQPNAGISVQMLEWARCAAVNDADPKKNGDDNAAESSKADEAEMKKKEKEEDVRRGDDFLELYCGNGNFTIAMAPMFRACLATEMSKVSVAAARENISANGADNITVARLSSEELTLAMDQGKHFTRLDGIDLDAFDLKTVLVDPPRAGMGPEVSQFVSRFPRIVYISCNPATLAEDVRTLEATHRVARFAVFDQFPYTPHLECGALLVAKGEDDGGGDGSSRHSPPDESGEFYPIDNTFNHS